MNREHLEWTARLSDYLADDLGEADRAEVEAHLSTCGACARALEEMVRVVTQAGALEDMEPSQDLWGGISAAIGGAARARGVIAFPGRSRVSGLGQARVELSRSRLAAAAVILVAVSASLSWWAGSARAGGSVTSDPSARDVVMATAPAPPAGMAEELAALEDILESTRAVLDPNTVRVVERSLSVIEQAIADSREALLQDPGNAFLAEHLERMYRRKLVYLQDAVRLVEWEG